MAADDSSVPVFRRGVRLAADVGTVRVGVAVCDADGILPTPLATLKRDRKGNTDIAVIVREALERGAIEAYVGLPRLLSGREGESAQLARDFAATLAQRLADAGSECEVRLVDERLTTVEAHRSLHAAGLGSREHRRVVDQVAAVGILQHALDLIRGRGAAGTAVAAPGTRSGEIRGDDSDMRG
ncbi:Holliday junction resolvase RuvX [Sinomonas mesophila]|uniref:Holliday junction resolvase RuvX n=1 Tax=Sinomonas mesophila TaxID=1531955 RepID=UPI001FE6C6F9|nr:Holliday junction resolvase RuvX [Sinomonas mesophila]